MNNPCVGCGACCAHYRVQFYWREANPGESPYARAVPPEMFEELDARFRCMKGTARKHRPQCRALKGRIGQTATCSIYEGRPSPCRQFAASYENGRHEPRCDQARAAHGLPPLRESEWRNSIKD